MHDPLPASPALLPAGFDDKLPPIAEAEARSVATLLEVFATHGYQRVEAPLAEFADTLLAGSGQAVAGQCFRVLDPESRRMLALRADITPQIARIASTRLAAAPRPLRLSYAGSCLRVAASPIAAERQLDQVGIELIGHDSPQADAEMVALAAEALAAIGLTRVSFDLTVPMLVPALLDHAALPAPARSQVVHALDRKDVAQVRAHAGPLATVLESLLLSAGRPSRALAALAVAALPPDAAALATRLAETITTITARSPGLTLTVDPVEARGFPYHTGVCVAVFAPGRHEELGRGGRYLCGGEAATGVTLYADAVLRAAAALPRRTRILLPPEAPAEPARRLRAEGHATVQALDPTPDPAAEAARLGCDAWLGSDGPVFLANPRILPP